MEGGIVNSTIWDPVHKGSKSLLHHINVLTSASRIHIQTTISHCKLYQSFMIVLLQQHICLFKNFMHIRGGGHSFGHLPIGQSSKVCTC